MKKLLLPVLACLLVITGCQKDIVEDPLPPVIGSPKLPPTPVQGSVAGIVVDENNLPVENADVTIGTTTLSTDERGMFNTTTLTLDKYISTVKVEMNGYFPAIRSFSANAAKNYVSIKLIPKTLTGSFASSSTGQISLTNGSTINFQANSVKLKSSGAPYSGTVNVYAAYVDPTSADFGSTVPGSLMAEDATRFYVLRSTGMIAVEMESPSGEPLQLETDKPATIKLSIPSSLQGVAPSTIDTWSLDERGIWIKEGTATRVGSAYEFQVSHFSFWNCDVPTTSVYLTINLKDQHGANHVNRLVSLTSSTTFGTTFGITDSLGNVSGLIPANESLTFKAYEGYYQCNNPFYSQNIGPYSSNASENIVAPYASSNVWTVSGTATNCVGIPLPSGTAIIYTGLYYQMHTPIVDGNYSITIPSCIPITSVTVIAVDNAAQLQSVATTVAVTGNTVSIPSLAACGTSTSQFINYDVDGTSFSITNGVTTSSLYAMVSATTVFISGFADQSGTTRIGFQVNGASAGTHNVSTSDSLMVNNIVTPIAQAGSTVTFTTFGGPGEYLEGNFNIPFQATGSVHTLTGNFRIRRN